MSWRTCKVLRKCKECELPLCPGERIWKEPRRYGLRCLLTRKRRVMEKSACYCEDCGKILEYEA